MITLTINGQRREFKDEMLLPKLLDTLGVDRRVVAVAHNGDVVPRDRYDNVRVRHGDAIEVVRMVGGG
jgi:thiamine biosynthesis protein ThiS